MVPEIKDGKERMVERKLFPGYVLVKMVMNDDTWYVCAIPAAAPVSSGLLPSRSP